MQRFTFKIFIVCSLLAMALTACEDIFEEDLEGKNVTLVAPESQLKSDQYTQQFIWEELEGALSYNLQIASPSFDGLQVMVLDSNPTGTRYDFTLAPGLYEWRVRAENASSQSNYRTRKLQIDSTASLTNQTIVLREPADGLMTNDVRLTFEWEAMANATEYSLLVVEEDFNGDLFTSEIITTGTSQGLPLDLAEGKYEWGIRGENALTNSFYAVRFLWVDVTPPAVAILQAPLDLAVVPDSQIVFRWNNAVDVGTPIVDSLFVFTDNQGLNLHSKSAGINGSETDSLGTGVYYWEVQRTDGAGNLILSDQLRQLTVQ